MHTNDPAHSSGGAPPETSTPNHRAFDKTRKTLYWLSAAESWRKSASFVRQRASFPMLRALLRREQEIAISPLQGFEITQLEKAMQVHALLLLLLTPILLWGLLTLARGVAALIRYHTITTWLLYSAPLCIFLATKLLVSYKTRIAIAAELKRRSEPHGRQRKEGSPSA